MRNGREDAEDAPPAKGLPRKAAGEAPEGPAAGRGAGKSPRGRRRAAGGKGASRRARSRAGRAANVNEVETTLAALSPPDREWLNSFLTSTEANDDPLLLQVVVNTLEVRGIEYLKANETMLRRQAEYIH